jgi:hypothetical protein
MSASPPAQPPRRFWLFCPSNPTRSPHTLALRELTLEPPHVLPRRIPKTSSMIRIIAAFSAAAAALALAPAPAHREGRRGTPVQAVLASWHSTSPHTPLMTCNPGFVPYCCGAFLSDPEDLDNMWCEDGKNSAPGLLEECT